jgi:hypothetical protein
LLTTIALHRINYAGKLIAADATCDVLCKIDTEEADEVIEAIAKTVAE